MEKNINNTEIRRYDIVFIGGGPSTVAFFSYLFQNRMIDKILPNANILIIEKSESFGAGCLGKYGINTNTSSEGFARLICIPEEKKGKQGKLALSPSRKPMKVSKNYNKQNIVRKQFEEEKNSKFNPIPLFNNLFKSSSVQTLLNIGNRPAPLTLVGYFLDSLGNYMVDYINTAYNKNILMNKTEVKGLKIYNNEEFGILIKNEQKGEMMIKSRCVIMATGGIQAIKNPLYNEIVQMKGEGNVYISDWLLQKEGYMNLYENIASSRTKRVVIIGGSHSGFSSAWIMLNCPSSYHNIKVSEDLPQKVDNKCEAGTCKCFGSVVDRNWYVDGTSIVEKFNIEIQILYRDHIRVFYSTEQDAISDGYTSYDRRALNKQGRVYPFIGIRGDAKELYRKIIRGEEKRVQLIKTFDDQHEYIQNADIVVWACGYNTNSIPIKDFRGNPVELYLDETGMIEVDKELHVMNRSKVSIRNLYGFGQGYSTKAPEMINGKKARADSIHLYNTHISMKLYRSLEGLLNKINVDNIGKFKRHETSLNIKKKSLDDDTKMNREYNFTKNLLLAKVNHTEKFFLEKYKSGSPKNGGFFPNLEKKKRVLDYGKMISNNILKKNINQ
jgi:hypothetical protein